MPESHTARPAADGRRVDETVLDSAVLDSAVLEALDSRLQAECREGGIVSVWLGGTDGATWWERDSRADHYAASTMKLPLVLAAQREIVAGRRDAHTDVLVHNRFASAADGSPFSLDIADDQDPPTWAAMGSTRTLAQLMDHAVTHSGNLATNLLLEHVGYPAVTAVLADAGADAATVVARGIEDARARQAGLDNRVSALDLGRIMAAVARDEPALGGPEVTAPVLAILHRQRHLDQIPAGLPTGTWTASKSGWVTGVSHDVALVRPDTRPPFVLAVCTTLGRSERAGAALVASVARELWTAMAR